MLLCDRCRNIFEQPATVQKEAWFAEWTCQTTLAVLRLSAATCFPCRVTKRFLDGDVSTKNNSEGLTVKLKYIIRKSHADDQAPWFSIQSQLESGKIYFGYMLLQAAAEYDPAKLVGDSTGSLETMTFIKERLRECEGHHIACQKLAAQYTWYPTRLVELFDHGARLILTRETEVTGRYASLSHRWGMSNTFRCTTRNIDSLKTNIPLPELSITFQDAFTTLRFLGIRYIWIDSLCIVQDLKEDWAREAGTMMKVYERACLNLAATASSGNQIGLFARRDPQWLHSEAFHIDNGALKGDFRLVEAALDMPYWDLEIETAPLNTRGWVMQERILSPRVVHFASEQIFWDCAELTASEALPSGIMARPRMESLWIGRKQNSPMSRLFKEPTTAIIGLWAAVVGAYSRCNLTYTTDKFIALAGLAEYFQDSLKEQFCSGLWRSQIEMQLCWVTRRSISQPTTRNDLAPSWSWASMNCPVRSPPLHLYEEYTMKVLATVLKVEMLRRDEIGIGQSYSGFLHMRCILNPVGLETMSDKLCLTGKGMEHAISVEPDTLEVTESKDLYLAPIFDVQDPFMAGRKLRISEVGGLLLRLVDGKSGVYVRCGHATLSARTDASTGSFAESWLSLFSAAGKEGLPCADFNVETGYLIKIA